MRILHLNSVWVKKFIFKFEKPNNYNRLKYQFTQDICQGRQVAVRKGCSEKAPTKRLKPHRKNTEKITQSATEDNGITPIACMQRAARSSVSQSTSARLQQQGIKAA